jgi:hypothetical protein
VSGCSRWNFADGLPETSNCYCHPGIAGGSPAYASLAHPHSVREHDLRYDRPETAEARRARQNQCPALGIAFASHRPYAHEWRLAAARLASARLANLRHRRGATMRGKTSAHRRNNPPYRRNSKRATPPTVAPHKPDMVAVAQTGRCSARRRGSGFLRAVRPRSEQARRVESEPG